MRRLVLLLSLACSGADDRGARTAAAVDGPATRSPESSPGSAATPPTVGAPEEGDASAATIEAALEGHGGAYQDLVIQRGIVMQVHSVSRLDEVTGWMGRLAEGTALLFYWHDGERLQVWLVDREGIRATAVTSLGADDLDRIAASLRSEIGVEAFDTTSETPIQTRAGGFSGNLEGARRRPDGPGASARAGDAAALAARVLVPPLVAAAMEGVERIVVVPVLGIGTVPFAMLRPFGTDESLLDRATLTVVPSLSDLATPPDPWNGAFSAPLVVGDPAIPRGLPVALGPLAGARREAQDVEARLGGSALLGGRATEATVAARAESADLLYLACHGIADVDDPLGGSFLVLARGGDSDGRWTAREIQELDLGSARLAVLSACQTGLGRAHDGGIIGLARAFQLAGVPRVVMSLWNVDDAWTLRLMGRFLDGLGAADPAAALRAAMLDVRRENPNPAAWAAFTVFGVPDRVGPEAPASEAPPARAPLTAQQCAQEAAQRRPGLRGRVVVEFEVVGVGGRGVVRNARVAESDVGDAALEACFVEAISARSMRAPTGGGTVRVRYPFEVRSE